MPDERTIDKTWGGKCGRVFATIWGKLSSFDISDRTIGEMKRTIYTEFDKQFKVEKYEFESASGEFIDVVLNEAEAVGCSVVQLGSLDLAIVNALEFDFCEERGNS